MRQQGVDIPSLICRRARHLPHPLPCILWAWVGGESTASKTATSLSRSLSLSVFLGPLCLTLTVLHVLPQHVQLEL